MPSYADITTKRILEDKDFYKVNKFFNTGAECSRLDYATHLLRVELWRVRSSDTGLTSEWIKDHEPDFVPGNFVGANATLVHSNLRRQVGYLRAELLLALAKSVQLKRSRVNAATVRGGE